jgi:squalene-hopene/tetraprenyl-beta-curcumene cyclase
VLLRHYPGSRSILARSRSRYLRRNQSAEHGGWGLFHAGAFDVSASAKAYYALKMIATIRDRRHGTRSGGDPRRGGGGGQCFPGSSWPFSCRIGCRPTMPPELILLPRWFLIHLSKMSYWSRTVVVPLLVLER